jgi:hypothetical protein
MTEMIYLGMGAVTHEVSSESEVTVDHLQALIQRDPMAFIEMQVDGLIEALTTHEEAIRTYRQCSELLGDDHPVDIDQAVDTYTAVLETLTTHFILPGWLTASEQDFAKAQARMGAFLSVVRL